MVAKSIAGSDTGAGLSLTKSGANNPNPIVHGGMGQAERAFSAASTFLSGVMAISASQFIGAPLKLVDPKFYDGYMAWTKESFAVLMTTITQWWAPTVVRVSGDDSMKGQLYQMDDGTLKCNFPHRLVLMANHQLYTDWLYLWWIAYTNKMHGRIYIILKESLKQLPIFGWGAQFYNFIFLSRKWETDRFRFRQALNHLKGPKDPMWLLIFPEGTNLSAVTREKSASWAKKTGLQDMKHQLLPRSTGLQFCLSELRHTTNWLYDCTIAYEGVPKGMYGQDIFTLRSSLFEGRPPKSVNMYWRRFRIGEIPVENEQAFGRWLNNRWREKDYLLEYFYKFGQFPADDPLTALAAVEGKKEPNHAKAITTEVRSGGWDEFLSIFGPITTAAGALQSIDMTEPIAFDALLSKVAAQQQLNLMNLGKAPIAATSQQAIRNALKAAQQRKALPQSVIDTLVKEAPQTQEQMKKALMKSGNPEVAKKAAQAPGAKAAKTQQNITMAAAEAQQVIGKASSRAPAKAPLNPAPAVKNAMPLANMQTMVTRPLSTMAMQTAASQVRNVAAQRAKTKGAALPGQSTPGAKGVRSVARAKQANAVPKALGVATSTPSVNGAKRANGVPKAPASAKGAPSVNSAKQNTTPNTRATAANAELANSSSKKANLTGASRPGAPTKKRSAGSKAIGVHKYASGKIA